MGMFSLKALRRSVREQTLAARVLPLGLGRGHPSVAPGAPPIVDPLAPLTNPPALKIASAPPQRILIAGVYLADRENTAPHLTESFDAVGQHSITQRWIALTLSGAGKIDLPHTHRVQNGPAPRFALLNEMLTDRDAFDWVFICDDDVELCEDFVARALSIARHCDFALFQPGRTAGSYIDLPLMRQAPGLLARRTRCVEIGPMVCIRKDAFPVILPFDQDSGMGWGLEYAWTAQLEAVRLRLGVIDGAPIAHRIRPTVANYSRSSAETHMSALLARTPHVPRDEAFTVLEAYAA
jgi:hypothetical protein